MGLKLITSFDWLYVCMTLVGTLTLMIERALISWKVAIILQSFDKTPFSTVPRIKVTPIMTNMVHFDYPLIFLIVRSSASDESNFGSSSETTK